jgi:hypothetical protein
MKSTSNIVSAIHNIKMADEHLQSFARDNPGSRVCTIFKTYTAKLDWILKDLYTTTFLPENVRMALKREVQSDAFSVPAIAEKIALLNPEQRDAVELMIETILKGESLTVELTPAGV